MALTPGQIRARGVLQSRADAGTIKPQGMQRLQMLRAGQSPQGMSSAVMQANPQIPQAPQMQAPQEQAPYSPVAAPGGIGGTMPPQTNLGAPMATPPKDKFFKSKESMMASAQPVSSAPPQMMTSPFKKFLPNGGGY